MDYFSYFEEHSEEIDSANALLADEKSRKVFHNLLQYKICRDPELIAKVRDDVSIYVVHWSLIMEQ